MKKTLTLSTLAPITTGRTLELKPEIQAITFRNAGTSTVNFNNGMYSLDPKETLHIAAVDNNDNVFVNGLGITFDTTVGNVNKLQIILLIAKDC